MMPVKESGPDANHQTLERLFAGPDHTALAQGAVTFIPDGTRLIGLTITRATAYADVSGTILKETIWTSTVPDGALTQLETTLLAMEGVEHCLILVDGKPMHSTP
jgi:spore germination protein GerM